MVEINPEALKVEMAKRGLTQPMLAEKAGVHQSTISRAMTSGKVGAVTAYKIGLALNLMAPLKLLEGLLEKAS